MWEREEEEEGEGTGDLEEVEERQVRGKCAMRLRREDARVQCMQTLRS